jgi:aspartate/glutamate racemase
MDDEGANDYADIDNEAGGAVEEQDNEFCCSLRSHIDRGNVNKEVTALVFDEVAVSKWSEPIILNILTFTMHAKAYALGNIWQRHLMSLSDHQLKLQRVTALMITAQYCMEFWLQEQEWYEREITELQMKHEKLWEVWQCVEEELKNGDELRAQKEQWLATISDLESN